MQKRLSVILWCKALSGWRKSCHKFAFYSQMLTRYLTREVGKFEMIFYSRFSYLDLPFSPTPELKLLTENLETVFDLIPLIYTPTPHRIETPHGELFWISDLIILISPNHPAIETVHGELWHVSCRDFAAHWKVTFSFCLPWGWNSIQEEQTNIWVFPKCTRMAYIWG